MHQVDRRQFIIMDKPYEREDFVSINLSHGRVLSYQKDLNVVRNEDIILLGYAFSVVSSKIELNDDAINDKRNWAGRWVLIYKDKLFMDACGTLGCCYGYSDTGELYISSSLNLLNKVLKRKEYANYKVKYGDGGGILDFYPIPYTPLVGIKKLMPSQFVDFLAENNIQPLDDYMLRRYKGEKKTWIKERFLNEFSSVLKNIEEEFCGEVWITLTGGVDSRVIFAIAQSYGINFKTYTAIRNNIKVWDRDYPIKICKKYHRKHYYIDDTKENDATREKIFDKHCGGYIVGTERRQYIAGSDIPVEKKAVVLWGTVWAAYIKSYFKCFNATDDIEEQISEINRGCDGILERSNVHMQSIKEWLQSIKDNPISELDWRERMYIEQRNGAWVSGAAQAIDLFDSIRIAPINCQELLELLLSLDVEPGDKGFQKEIIEECCPELKRIPYGEPTDILYRVKRKIRRIFKL